MHEDNHDLNSAAMGRQEVFDIGLGLTSRCNAKCPHCYSMGLGRSADLSLEVIRRLLDSLNVRSVNLGTGEVALHPEFQSVIHFLMDRVPRVSITSNGTTIQQMSDDDLRRMHDVDISLDFPRREQHDKFRGVRLFDLAISQIERCLNLGVRCSIATAVTHDNIGELEGMLELCRLYRIAFRLNLYKQTGPHNLTPSYSEFWSAFQSFFMEARLISCSEPILRVVLGLTDHGIGGSPCTMNSLRIKPNGTVSRCVYLSGNLKVDKVPQSELATRLLNLRHPTDIPRICLGCQYVAVCQGGCESRRLLLGDISSPDSYCPFAHGEELYITPLTAERADPDDYVHSSYLCTLIVQ